MKILIFGAGAVGDQAPSLTDDPRQAQVRYLGERLAQAAVDIAPEAVDSSPHRVAAVTEAWRLPSPQLRAGRARLPGWLGGRLLDPQARLHLVALGPWLLIGAPADVGVEVAADWRAAAEARGFHPIVIGFSDDYIGYVLPAAAYDPSSYEGQMQFYGPGLAQAMTDVMVRLMDRLMVEHGNAH